MTFVKGVGPDSALAQAFQRVSQSIPEQANGGREAAASLVSQNAAAANASKPEPEKQPEEAKNNARVPEAVSAGEKQSATGEEVSAEKLAAAEQRVAENTEGRAQAAQRASLNLFA